MFRYLSSFIILISISFSAVANNENKVLKLYNWEDYMPQFVIDGFEKKAVIASKKFIMKLMNSKKNY